MKHFFTILMLLYFAYNSNAQTYVPFPTSADTAVWLQRAGNVNINMGAAFTVELRAKGDTIFDGKVYTKIYYNNYYYASIRAESKIIYLRDLNSYNINIDTILYDFNIQVGDTVKWFGTENLFEKPIISSVDSILIDGIYRKRYEINSINSLQPFSIIEGIGSNSGLLPLYNTFESYQELVCFTLNGSTIYTEPGNPTCIVSTNQIKQTDNISIHPNPTSSILNIQFEDFEQRNFVIYNQLGQQVLSEISNEMNVILNVELLPKGFYVLVIQTEKGRFTKKIVKE